MNKEIVLPADEMYIPAVELRAGDIRALYEEGRLRYICAGGTEIIRMIYPALRNQDWTTILPARNEEKISRQSGSFNISYSALYEAGEVKYRAFYSIEGRADNTITFSMRGEALSSFSKRRIGLCTLHPIDTCSGREVEVLQPDGTTYTSSFPEFVSPLQPLMNITAMKWITGTNVLVDLAFEGDIFETEDQRNWSDNSYKTYSTPLSVPAPAIVNKGDTVEQKITIHVDVRNIEERKTKNTVPELRQPVPKIGYMRAKDQQPLSAAQVALLNNIPFHHYGVHLLLSENWKPLLQQAVTEAKALHTTLELSVTFDELSDRKIREVCEALVPSKQHISSILVLSANHEAAPIGFFEKAYTALKNSLGNIRIGYGTNGDFADLNRNRPGDIEYDFVNFHLQPQVHTIDSRSVMDNLGSHQTLLSSSSKFTGGKPVHVSAVNFSSSEIPDKRFGTAFTAWWTLQALRNLGAAASITFFELTGREGIINGEGTTPVYDALKALKAFAPQFILQNTGTKVVFEKTSGERLWFSSKLPGPDSIK